MSLDGVANSIIRLISGSDSAGKDNLEVDTLFEYEKLGEYLNGSLVENAPAYSELSKKDKNILQKYYAQLKDKFSNLFSNENTLPEINSGNVNNYVSMYAELNLKTDRNQTEEQNYQKIIKALYQYAINSGYDLSGFEPGQVDFKFVMSEINELTRIKQERENLAEKSLKLINEPYENTKLESAVNKFVEEHNVEKKTDSTGNIDLGNGKFDKPATQQTEVCWALASINALLTTQEGTKLLESNKYYDNNTGVFAIHLQEAEDNGFHDGIYIITPEDIEKESPNLVQGEGDAAAYVIAIKKYFEEVNQNPELKTKMESGKHAVIDMDSGNYSFRFFEVLTGGKFTQYRFRDKDNKLQNGIGTGDPYYAGGFDEIYNMADKKEGAAVLVIAAHSISVIGTRNGKLLVQESNNNADFSQKFSDKNHILFRRVEDINGAPAYELSKEDYENYINAISFLKW